MADFSTSKIVLIVVTIIIVLILFCCLCNGMNLCGSSKCLFKKKCEKTYCKKCGCIPCSCNSADICSVTRTLTTAGVATTSPDEYVFVVEGSGLTATTISSTVLNVEDSVTPANNYTLTYTPTDVGTGNRLVYSPSGYSMSFVFTTENVGAAGGPATSGNVSPTVVYTLVGTVLTLTVQMLIV